LENKPEQKLISENCAITAGHWNLMRKVLDPAFLNWGACPLCGLKGSQGDAIIAATCCWKALNALFL